MTLVTFIRFLITIVIISFVYQELHSKALVASLAFIFIGLEVMSYRLTAHIDHTNINWRLSQVRINDLNSRIKSRGGSH